ncbi:methylated-DNA--protein-cysteine methyltransferase isoform X2 [Dendropsophus ebraccatus]|uniref:methylated-DNA--protein-cysteine methyltransferase isoform X2 n=1 Tax=Dendropsophus ebraccatus TaxID=150705 RepID=UPI0038315B47
MAISCIPILSSLYTRSGGAGSRKRALIRARVIISRGCAALHCGTCSLARSRAAWSELLMLPGRAFTGTTEAASRLLLKMALSNGNCKMEEVLIKSPVGEIQVSGCELGIHEIKLMSCDVTESGAEDASTSFKVCGGPQEMVAPLKQCTDWLRAYFCEPCLIEKYPTPDFHHPLFQKDSFQKSVLLALLKNVTMGKTITYKELAELSGNARAARAVGGAMRNNPVPLIIPCHRVICSDGKIGNYSGGKRNNVKLWLLAHEKHGNEM